MHAKELALLGTTTTLVRGFGRIRLERVMGAIMELMDKFLRNQSIIELMDKFLNKLTIGPQAKEEDLGLCNLKRGGTDQPSK